MNVQQIAEQRVADQMRAMGMTQGPSGEWLTRAQVLNAAEAARRAAIVTPAPAGVVVDHDYPRLDTTANPPPPVTPPVVTPPASVSAPVSASVPFAEPIVPVSELSATPAGFKLPTLELSPIDYEGWPSNADSLSTQPPDNGTLESSFFGEDESGTGGGSKKTRRKKARKKTSKPKGKKAAKSKGKKAARSKAKPKARKKAAAKKRRKVPAWRKP